MKQLCVELDTLSAAERRDLANALLRAAWSASLEPTRIPLLELLVEVDDSRPRRSRMTEQARSKGPGVRALAEAVIQRLADRGLFDYAGAGSATWAGPE